ncbi:hypothetical protein RA28_17830 [Ruegeria sp. ANG-S4]|uniref:hypothetical protein n=1 Tax=Ruegeria sp. ANG-S4 TaxID=1577904 RepID=UPI00058080DD|nr:hypothetical protein [Ruegeria sp. ANG-S4]KIC43534.1 hypothetical protein RA28_17830 [Ruegeria sp. ANG-S4]
MTKTDETPQRVNAIPTFMFPTLVSVMSVTEVPNSQAYNNARSHTVARKKDMSAPDVKKVEAAQKKMHAEMQAYKKSQDELEKANKEMSKFEAAIKSGDMSKLGPATKGLAKIGNKIFNLQKKAATQKKKMDDALNALTKTLKGK